MKVWEKCNEVKGTNASIDEIAGWGYMNRICPLMFDEGLEIDLLPRGEDGYPVKNGFLNTAEKICGVMHGEKGTDACSYDCLMRYLNSEYEED
jgi:hypothetical protein